MSNLQRKDNAFIPGGLCLNWDRRHEYIPDNANLCYLVALDNRQIDVLLSLLSHMRYYWLWDTQKSNLQPIVEWLWSLEFCLMSGCSVEQLIAKLDEIKNTLASGNAQQTLDLGNISLTIASGDAQQTADLNTINATLATVTTALADIKTSIDALPDSDLEDDLANVWSQLSGVLQVLAGVSQTVGSPL